MNYNLFFFTKTMVSALVIALVSTLAKRYSALATLLASLPLVSLMTFVWIYLETGDTRKISQISSGIMWLLIPSFVFFIVMWFFLKNDTNFWISLFVGMGATALSYFLFLYVLRRFGISL